MKKGTHILSIYIGVHDSCLSISSGDEVLLHFEAERFFRKKHIRCTPDQMRHLIGAGLEYLKLTINDVLEVVMTSDDRRTGKLDAFLQGPQKSEANILGRIFKPLFASHHLCHIAACRPAGFSDALIICADAGSREGSTRFYHQVGENIEDLANYADQVFTGKFYGTITQLIIDPDIMNAHVQYPGKTMGLAGWGEISDQLYKLLDENRQELNQLHFESVAHLRELFGISADYNQPWLDKNRRDLAATAQRFWEDEFMKAIKEHAQRSRNICLVGGCALNVLLNTRINNSGLFEKVYIPPVASDCCQSLGALLHFFPDLRTDYPFLGRGFGECREVPDRLVEDLLQHRIVGWYEGRSEIGPRALGHRSFLGLPDSEAMRVKLSEGVKGREPYRPVAPMVLETDVGKYLDFAGRSEFMTFAPVVKDLAREQAPAIVHRDNTCRVQTVSEKSNSILGMVCQELKAKGRPPILMNSSFNLRGQPIVDTPENALQTFKNSSADVLYLNGQRWIH